MKKNVVNWFEIPAKDLGRAKKFYADVFGSELTDMNMPGMEMAAFPWIQEGQFTAGALVKSVGYEPSSSGTVVYFYCEDLSNELGRVAKNGGSVVLPKTAIGEFGFIALVVDSEGNRIGLHSEK